MAEAKKTTKKPVSKKKEDDAAIVKKAVKAKASSSRADKTSQEKEEDDKPNRYWEAVGRRKRAVARVRLFTRGEKGIFINEKTLSEYFPTIELQNKVLGALEKMKSMERFRTSVKVKGGGIHGQAEAVRHGTARALTKFNSDFGKRLRKAGYLTRDPREKERKKYGLKKARKAPQWSKR